MLQKKITTFNNCLSGYLGRRGGLMVSALVPGASGPGSSPGREHCVVFLGKTLQLSQCRSLQKY